MKITIEIQVEKVEYYWDAGLAVYKDGELFDTASVLMASSSGEAMSEALRLAHKILLTE